MTEANVVTETLFWWTIKCRVFRPYYSSRSIQPQHVCSTPTTLLNLGMLCTSWKVPVYSYSLPRVWVWSARWENNNHNSPIRLPEDGSPRSLIVRYIYSNAVFIFQDNIHISIIYGHHLHDSICAMRYEPTLEYNWAPEPLQVFSTLRMNRRCPLWTRRITANCWTLHLQQFFDVLLSWSYFFLSFHIQEPLTTLTRFRLMRFGWWAFTGI